MITARLDHAAPRAYTRSCVVGQVLNGAAARFATRCNARSTIFGRGETTSRKAAASRHCHGLIDTGSKMDDFIYEGSRAPATEANWIAVSPEACVPGHQHQSLGHA